MKVTGRKDNSRLTGFIALFFVLVCFVIAGSIENKYSVEGKVIKQTGTVLIVEDTVQERWQYITDERFEKNDKVKLFFFNNTTEGTREDDELIRVKRVK